MLVSSKPVDAQFSYPSLLERYYKQFQSHFSVDENGVCHPHFYILQHSNKICVVCLGSGHPVRSEFGAPKVCQVDLQVSRRTDRGSNQARGKSKRGAQRLSSSSVLCYLCCENGERFPVYSCIEGNLIEMNELVIREPHLMVSRPLEEGHIAVIMPAFQDRSSVCENNLVVMRERVTSNQIVEGRCSIAKSL